MDALLYRNSSAEVGQLNRVPLRRVRICPRSAGDGFGKRYYEALRRDPDVALAHAAVKKLLRKSVFHWN
jgi:hypothetical protein